VLFRSLLRAGFYDGVDSHFLALARGEGALYDEFVSLAGADRVFCLTERAHLEDGGQLSPELIAHLIDTLSQTILRLGIDRLILSLPITNFVGRMAAMPHAAVRVIAFEHFAFADRRMEILRATAHRCNAVFGDTPATLDAVRGDYAQGQPLHYVPMVILEAEAARAPQPQQSAPLRLLSFGRLEPQKNYANLLRAVAGLAGEGIELSLTIAGEGRERGMLENLARELGVDKRVAMPGFVSAPQDLARLRAEADLYVQSSQVEGFCLAVAEAMAAGMPVVATATGGVRDYGIDGVNMTYIDGVAPDDIAATLRRVIANFPEQAPRLSAAALETAKTHFSEAAVRAAWRPAQALLV
jgi:glycosyltransferase involved in cell wall biosynthesis